MANSSYTFDNIISSGSGYFSKESGFSASVRRMQTKLNRLGYNCGSADGYFGANTETQVKAFQRDQGLTADGKAGKATLSRLDALSPDTEDENYGRELTHAQLTSGYSNSAISNVEALARTIYGEDTRYSDGQAAVAKELYNRQRSSRKFGSLSGTSAGSKSWKGICYDSSQYAVMTGPSSDTENSRKPNQYSTEWARCVSLAKTLVRGVKPSSTLGTQCFHLSANSSYPSNSVASTRVQIPAGVGNKFFDYQTTL